MKATIPVLSLLLLSGCGVEPTENELSEAMNKFFREFMENAAGGGGGSMVASSTPKVASLKKHSCKAEGGKVYSCDATYEMKVMGAVMKQTGVIRVVKDTDGWTVSNQ